MWRPKPLAMPAIALAAALAGCGGGDGGGSAPTGSIVAPAPTPTTTPTPTPSPTPVGLSNLVGAHQFVARGFGHLQTSGPFEDVLVPGTIAAERLGLAFSGSRYQVDIPGLPLDSLTPSGGSFANGVPATYNHTGRNGLIFTFVEPAGIDLAPRLTHSSFGYWSYPVSIDGGPRFRGGTFVYGLPTPTNEVPAAGRIDYRASLFAHTDLGVGGGGINFYESGRGQLTFDFGARVLEGAISTVGLLGATTTAPIRLELTGVAYVSGAATFSGRFRWPDGSVGGSFEGEFTGPQAGEMIARWQAPFVDQATGKTGTLYGVWLAKRM